MLYRVFSPIDGIPIFTSIGYTWNTVPSRTWVCSFEGTEDLGSLTLLRPSAFPLINVFNRQYFPEPFLWDTFYHLVEAAVAMRDGPEDAEWDFEIVHRDIKPRNSKAFYTRLFDGWDDYSMGISLFRRRERGERLSFLPSCQDGRLWPGCHD